MNVFEVDGKIAQAYPEMLAQMKKEARFFAENFNDSSDVMSDWGHKYFCPDDGAILIFDETKPHEHECSFCHKVHKSKTLDNVWAFTYRNTAVVTLLKLAVLYHVEKDPYYIEQYKKILGFYAENYDKFPLHTKNTILYLPEDSIVWDVGKIMPQGLNEAIITIRMTISLEMLKDDLDQEFKDMVINKLLIPACKLVLIPQVHEIHNKPVWADCAIAIIGMFSGNEELIDFAYNSKLGLFEQMRQGVTGDNFWYESSIHYNYFLLEGLIQLLAFTKIYDKPIECEQVVVEMLKEGYVYAFDNDVFPNPNDSWANINMKTYDYSYALATKIFGEDSEVGNIYKNILANPVPRGELPLSKPYYVSDSISFNHLVCTPFIDIDNRTPIERTSKCYKSQYFIKLKNEKVNLFLKYGHTSPSHSHPDKMNIEVTFKDKLLARDIANSGYTGTLCEEWNRKTLAHNTVIVDGVDHMSILPGEVLEYSDTKCKTIVKNAYEGIDFKRGAEIFENGFSDEFEVNSADMHSYDFVFHTEAKLISEVDGTSAEIGYNKNGYQYLFDVKKVNCTQDSITLNWKLDDINIESVIDVKGKELFIANSYDNPATKYRVTLILREKTQNAKFNMSWNMK
ncbi:MAG: heparinase II/III family protein [Clostridia bacterium]